MIWASFTPSGALILLRDDINVSTTSRKRTRSFQLKNTIPVLKHAGGSIMIREDFVASGVELLTIMKRKRKRKQ